METLSDLLAGLGDKDLRQLREIWKQHYGAPPAMKSPAFLRQLLAWRLQADVYGGLAPETARALKRSGPSQQATLRPGLRLSREWKGVRHEVEVVENGVRYADQIYASLSEVARTITGVRWNGPRFFGLRGGS